MKTQGKVTSPKANYSIGMDANDTEEDDLR
jgi:hypothetical protein